jgi:serine-type D-Ala-D-Ala endopeptidase (penicillin-binding protein 7)
MIEDEFRERRFYAVSYEDDIPRPGNGMLIPYHKKELAKQQSRSLAISRYVAPTIVTITGLLYMFTLGAIGVDTYAKYNVASLPAVSVINPLTEEVHTLNYGVQVALEQPSFFAETRDAFIEEAVTFIEVDLTEMQLRYFEEGVLVKSFAILAKGEEGTWWETPAGLYAVESKKDRRFSSFSQVYQPWSMSFQGNFFIHGLPEYADKSAVSEDFSGGGIRLATEYAKQLYELVKLKTPVLVHDSRPAAESFLYEPKIPELATPHYLIADIESSTVLAASDLDAAAPIASLTKLMTALVAAENINLDTTVAVSQPTFVASLIPRLGDRGRVSMYSLIQLLLVESSNEAAEVIAAELGRETFLAKMNAKAAELGLTQTHFADPSGLSAENISSVGDLLRLTQYIAEHRRFIFEITANQNLPTAYVSGEFGELVNFNKVENLENFIGGKVGETIAAGQTSITLHRLMVKGSERTLAIIILGSEDRNTDVRALYEYAKERFAK